ncbi:MAG TPA: gluconate 2-dehydrogenase subunit 3 family protein [Cyclobacteriaceae bacterium]|nr:gluconate 2-dehydrogenase subunit 3 family protein [Cyclobacteriaceae bacterium]
MDRRKYLKTLAVGSLSAGVLIDSCAPAENKEISPEEVAASEGGPNRQPDEIARYKKITAEKFFDDHEMKTITILVDIIIPRDEVSGSATDAGVPDFIEFIVKDMPRHQVPLRGGLKWLDLQCMKRFGKPFADVSTAQQLEMVDEIAWPEKAKPEMQQGVAFFNQLRDLTATGFYTSKIGIADLGYVGNKPNQWDGVPADVLEQYGLKYDERTLAESVKFDS